MKESYIYSVCVLLIILNVALNLFCRDDLFQVGVNFIIYMQQNYETAALNVFFVLVTTLIDPLVVLIYAVILMIYIHNKFKAFVILLYIIGNTYLTGVLKAFYADPRPIWASQQVANIGFYCPQQYGNPSGHSWFAMVLTFGVLIENYGTGKYYSKFIISMFVCVLVPFSRMYLGAHSLNQVLQGTMLGLTVNVMYIFGLQNAIKRFLRHFTDPHYRYWYWSCLVLAHAAYFFTFFFHSIEQIPDSWRDNILKKCGKLVDRGHLNFMMLMINSLLVNSATGAALGFSYLVKKDEGRCYLRGQWKIYSAEPNKKPAFRTHLAFFMIEFWCMFSGLTVAGLLLTVIKGRFWVFLIANLGAFTSGFIYSKCTSEILCQNKIIIIEQEKKRTAKSKSVEKPEQSRDHPHDQSTEMTSLKANQQTGKDK